MRLPAADCLYIWLLGAPAPPSPTPGLCSYMYSPLGTVPRPAVPTLPSNSGYATEVRPTDNRWSRSACRSSFYRHAILVSVLSCRRTRPRKLRATRQATRTRHRSFSLVLCVVLRANWTSPGYSYLHRPVNRLNRERFVAVFHAPVAFFLTTANDFYRAKLRVARYCHGMLSVCLSVRL